MIFLTDNLEQHSDSEIDQFHVPNGIIPHHQLQVYPDNLNLKGKGFFVLLESVRQWGMVQNES